jgi:hypothetical protein
MNRRFGGITILILLCAGMQARGADPKKQKKPPEPSMLDKYLNSASATSGEDSAVSSPGSIWSASARLDDLARDLRANRVDDVVHHRHRNDQCRRQRRQHDRAGFER